MESSCHPYRGGVITVISIEYAGAYDVHFKFVANYGRLLASHPLLSNRKFNNHEEIVEVTLERIKNRIDSLLDHQQGQQGAC